MTFKRLFKESFLVMAWILGFIWVISNIPINADVFSPISDTFKDFELTDMYFSHFKESEDEENNIVLVNIGVLPREGVAELINVLNEYQPKAIGIDAFFRKPDLANPKQDSALAAAFSKTKNLVLVSELIENAKTGKVDTIKYSNPVFMQYAQPAFADMIAEGKHSLNTARDCIPKEIFNGDTLLSFPSKLVNIYAPEKLKRYLARNHDIEPINYQGNINVYTEGSTENSKTVFTALDWYDVLDRKFTPETIKDKIVIMGFMGDEIGQNNWEDKFCTPLNSQYVGRTAPDMYGVVVHANIVSMILKEKYINDMPDWLNLTLTLLFIFFNIWIFNWLYLNTAEWWDGISMVLSLVGVIMLSVAMVMIFHFYNYTFNIALASVALLLSGNLIELYWGIIKPLYMRTKEKVVSLQDQNNTGESL
ncbi:MAG TPA: CHASE2 domain-containing protein [Cytophaga sp.]|jgi:CHASE2 domain-containing sensor protein|nr:CHASE2 domain-containing protein [Cytophaga sp.]